MSGVPLEVESIVKSKFKVNDTFQLPDGEVEYRIQYEPSSKEKFEELCAELEPKDLTPWLSGRGTDCTLQVRKRQQLKPSASRIPVILALLTVGSVLVFGLVERQTFGQFAPGIPDYVVFISYAACMVAILAAHEFGHRYASEKNGVPPPTPYFIPGIPVVTAFLPSLGIISLPRRPAVNRDALFDLSLAGPLAAFAVTVLLYIVSEFAAVQSAVPMLGAQLQNAQIYNPSTIQFAIDSAFSSFVPGVTGGYLRLSPVADAASVGFVLTFLSLLPISLFDGGQMAATVLGPRTARVATYLSMVALVTLDSPTYWVVAFLFIVIGARQANAQVLDEVSGISPTKRALFLLMIVLAFLCVPIPQNLASFPLG
ncbi:MAG: site-2 protease family protein [Nitrososphaerales archaeon]|nr:site-2 protease family protein [Nitrososphaerales archaeon]